MAVNEWFDVLHYLRKTTHKQFVYPFMLIPGSRVPVFRILAEHFLKNRGVVVVNPFIPDYIVECFTKSSPTVMFNAHDFYGNFSPDEDSIVSGENLMGESQGNDKFDGEGDCDYFSEERGPVVCSVDVSPRNLKFTGDLLPALMLSANLPISDGRRGLILSQWLGGVGDIPQYLDVNYKTFGSITFLSDIDLNCSLPQIIGTLVIVIKKFWGFVATDDFVLGESLLGDVAQKDFSQMFPELNSFLHGIVTYTDGAIIDSSAIDTFYAINRMLDRPFFDYSMDFPSLAYPLIPRAASMFWDSYAQIELLPSLLEKTFGEGIGRIQPNSLPCYNIGNGCTFSYEFISKCGVKVYGSDTLVKVMDFFSSNQRKAGFKSLLEE